MWGSWKSRGCVVAGALYVDQTTGRDKADDGVSPGATFTYVWRVRPTFAPTPDDGPCLPWVYHSHVMPTRDVDSGLVGLLLTCKTGNLVLVGSANVLQYAEG